MRLYMALCSTLEGLGQALTAWAEGERLNTLEYQMAELDGDE